MPRLRRPSAPHCRGPRSAAPARGFTVVELLVALAIASLLLVLAAPPWRARIAAAELRERAEALSAALAAARSEAIKRGTRVDLCASADRLGCAAGGEWEAGWLGFVNDACHVVCDDPRRQRIPRIGRLVAEFKVLENSSQQRQLGWFKNTRFHSFSSNWHSDTPRSRG